MLCEKCKQREANIRYTEVRNGIRSEHSICSQCAKEMDFGQYTGIFDTDYPIGKLLADLFGTFAADSTEEEIEGNRVICPACQMTYSDFLTGSRFGCPDCYRVFDLLMEDKVKTIQGSIQHRGKHPKNVRFPEPQVKEETVQEPELPEETPEEQLEILRARLQEALAEEEYEQAAKYRDEIRALKEVLHE